MNIGPDGLKLIEYFEGFRAARYQNPDDVPTIGYGTTAAAGVVDPLPMICTQLEAEEWLRAYIDRSVLPSLQAAATVGRQRFNQAQIDALASLGYNVGADVFSPQHTIGYNIRQGASHATISENFLLYEGGDGQVQLAGLVTRREAERALFDRGRLIL